MMKVMLRDLTGSRTIFSCGNMSGHCGLDVKCQGLKRLTPDAVFSKHSCLLLAKKSCLFLPSVFVTFLLDYYTNLFVYYL